MRLIVMGGGKVGSQIATDLEADGHSVVVIESRRERAEYLADTTNLLVVHGDGTDLVLLEEIGIRPDDFFLALTSMDQDNLAACELVRITYGVTRVLARLNDPKNHATFDALDIEYVSVTDLLARIITDRLELAELGEASMSGDAGLTFLTVLVPADAVAQRIHEVDLPASTIIVAIERDSGMAIPTGDSLIEPGNRVVVLTHSGTEAEVAAALAEKSGD